MGNRLIREVTEEAVAAAISGSRPAAPSAPPPGEEAAADDIAAGGDSGTAVDSAEETSGQEPQSVVAAGALQAASPGMPSPSAMAAAAPAAAARARSGARKGGTRVTTSATAEQKALWDSAPQYSMVLKRRNRQSGLMDELGQWPARDRSDAFNRAWVRDLYGGGQYQLQVGPVNDFEHFWHMFSFSFPGVEKGAGAAGGGLAALLAGGGDQQIDLSTLAMLGGGNGQGLGGGVVQTMLLLRMLGPQQPQTDPALLATLQEIKSQGRHSLAADPAFLALQAEIRSSRETIEALGAQREQDERDRKHDEQLRELQRRHDDSLRELRESNKALADKINAPPRETGMDKFLAGLPTLLPMFLPMFTSMMDRGKEAGQFYQALSNAERSQVQWMLTQVLATKDPAKEAQATAALSGLVLNLMTGMSGLITAQGKGEGTGQIVARIVENLVSGAKQFLGPLLVTKLAGNDPNALAEIEKAIAANAAGQAGQLPQGPPAPPQIPPPPAVTPPIVPPGTKVEIPRAGSPGATTAPTPGEPKRQAPVAHIRRLAQWIRNRERPERVIQLLANYYVLQYEADMVPEEWQQEQWWTGMWDDVIRGLSHLLAAAGEEVTAVEQPYLEALRHAAAEIRTEVLRNLASLTGDVPPPRQPAPTPSDATNPPAPEPARPAPPPSAPAPAPSAADAGPERGHGAERADVIPEAVIPQAGPSVPPMDGVT